MFKHDFPFDPTYGYDQSRLLEIKPPPTPPDYVDFWRQTYAETRSVPLRLSIEPSSFSNQAFEVFEVRFNGFGNFRCGAWITIPRGTRPNRGIVVGHGYGSRTMPDVWFLPGPPSACIFPVGRGFTISGHPDLPNFVADHVIHGIDSRETYLHRGCITDFWSAASALIEVVPTVEGRIDVFGGSFGGGIGAMALAWEERFKRAYLACPSFGHHPLRLTMQCVGSGEAVRRYAAQHPRIIEQTLPYYDSAIAAQFIKQPTLVAPGLFDPAVPPPGQFAVYNALKGDHALHVMPAAHYSWPDEAKDNRRLNDRLVEWFA